MTAPQDSSGPKLPKTYRAFVTKFPELGAAHDSVARAVENAGPLDRKTCELIKIGISMGAGLESATKSHVRRALEAGAVPQEIEQAILLGMNTRGFPSTVAAWQWAWEQIERNRGESFSHG
jgi:4-carboxymuconolactone decarboxylase